MSTLERSSGDLSNRLIKPDISLLFTKLNKYLSGERIQAYVVGGFVRDALLDRETADIDIAVAGDSLRIASNVASAFGGKYVLLDKVNRIGRVILADREATEAGRQWEIDFSSFSGSIEQDLAQRDFTIDAMAIELGRLAAGGPDTRIRDPFGGLNDLRQGVIRVVSQTALPSDPVRLLRGVRLAYELGFSLDGEAEALIRHYSSLVSEVAGERVREELLRLLAIPQAEGLLFHLDKLGLLTSIIPELAQEKGVEQPKEHFWNVFDHSLMTVAAVDFLLRRGSWEYANAEVLAAIPWSSALGEHFNHEVSSGSTRRVMLKAAALLHDLAKPQTKTIEANGRVRFLGHAKQGAVITAGILERLRFTSREKKLVATMVEYHLRPTQMSQNELPSPRAIYRYFRDTAEAGIDILFLSLADHLATRGPHLKLANWREHTRLVDYVLAKRFEEQSLPQSPKLISGHDLIKAFSFKPGPKIGELLEAVREAQAAGELSTREEALAYVSQRLKVKDERYDQKK